MYDSHEVKSHADKDGRVTVEEGAEAGQVIHFKAADGRTMEVKAPRGVTPGGTIVVKIPPTAAPLFFEEQKVSREQQQTEEERERERLARSWVERFGRRGTEQNELFRSEFGQNSCKIQEFPLESSKISKNFQH